MDIMNNIEVTSSILMDSLQKSHKVENAMNQLHSTSRKEKRAFPLPPISTDHITLLPGTFSFCVLVSSFGPNLVKQSSLWDKGSGFDLTTAIGLLRVDGKNEIENISIQNYIINEIGIERLKELVALIDVYRMLSSGRDQTQNIEVTLKQILQRIGKGNHADDRDKQTHLLNTVLYLSRTSVINNLSEQTKIPPLLALEGFTIDERGNNWLSYHLSTEAFEALYNPQSLSYPLPTYQVLKYHSARDCYALLLTFFLGNRLSEEPYSRYFTTLCVESGLLSYDEILPGETNRTRHAMQLISAILQLEHAEFIRLDTHKDLDTILAANYCEEAYERREMHYQDYTLQRIEQHIFEFSGETKASLRTRRRKAIQNLLNIEASREDREEEYPEWGTRITIRPGAQFLASQCDLTIEDKK